MAAETNSTELDYEFLPYIKVYKNGHVERLRGTDTIPAGTDPQTGVTSKDVINIIPETEVYVRIYLPKVRSNNQKLPLLVYFHGGDSAGANITHNLAMAVGNPESGVNVEIFGIALVDPYFWGSDPIGSEAQNPRKEFVDRLWPLVCPSCPSNDDPWINPVLESGSGLMGLGCWRVLVCVAEKDVLKDRGWQYFQVLSRSGWMGMVEIQEIDGQDHVFHLHDLNGDKAKQRMTTTAAFFNRDSPPPLLQ